MYISSYVFFPLIMRTNNKRLMNTPPIMINSYRPIKSILETPLLNQ